MSVKCSDIIAAMEKYAPEALAEEWDNVGFMTGEYNREVKRILVALDANDGVIDEAIAKKADIIVTHHPFIFRPIKNVNDTTPQGARLIKLIKNNIAVFSAHTNLDCAVGGTNDTLSQLIGLKNTEGLAEVNEDGTAMGRIGDLPSPLSFAEFIEQMKSVLGAEYLSVCGELDKTVSRVGICTGKGASFMGTAKAKGADVYITGDFGYHEGQTASELGLCVVDGTHYLTEVIVVPVLCRYLKKCFADVDVIESEFDGQTINIV